MRVQKGLHIFLHWVISNISLRRNMLKLESYTSTVNRKSPRGFLYNFFKFRKIHSETFENTNVGVLFLIKPIQHRYFPVSLANFQEQLVYKTTPDDCFQGRSTQRSGLKGVSQPPPKKKRKKKTK